MSLPRNGIAANFPTRLWRAWYRLAPRLLLALVIALAFLAALPLLVPKDWLGRKLAGAMANQLGRPVRIGSLRLGWAEGLVLERIEVDRNPHFGPGLLASVAQVRCSLAPWRWLRHNLGHIQIDGPQLWIVLDQAGRLNIADLPSSYGPFREDSWSIRSAVLHLVDQQRGRQLDLQLGVLECQMDRQTGRAVWRVHGNLIEQVQAGPAVSGSLAGAARVLSEGVLSVPRLNRNVPLGGGGRLEWKRLDLATVPVYLARGLGIDKLGGFSDGHLELTLGPDLSLAWRLEARFASLEAWRCGKSEPQRLDSLQLSVSGKWNPNAELLQIDQLRCAVPGFELGHDPQTGQPAAVLARRSSEPVRLTLAGRVENLATLVQHLPDVQKLLSGTSLDGACQFTFRWVKSSQADELDARLWSDRVKVSRPGLINCQEGCPAELAVAAEYEHPTRRLRVRQLRMGLGDLAAQVQADLPVPAPDVALETWLRQLPGEAGLEAQITTSRLEHVLAVWPVLADQLGGAELRGPASVRASLVRDRPAWFEFDAVLPEGSVCRVGELLDKKPETTLRATARVGLAGLAEGTIDQFSAELTCGGGRAELTPAGGLHTWMHLAGQDRLEVEASLGAELALAGIEELIEAVPAARVWLAGQEDGAAVSGRCKARLGFQLRGALESNRAVPEVWRLRASVDADGMALGLTRPTAVRKPAAVPLQLDLDYLYDRSAPQFGYQGGLRWRAEGVAGTIQVGWGDADEALRLSLRVQDVPTALTYLPDLARRLAGYELVGGFGVSATALGEAEGQRLDLELEAGGLGLVLAGDPLLRKPAGMPLSLAARLRSFPSSAGGTAQEFMIEQLQAELAGCQAQVAGGRFVLGAGPTGGAASRDAGGDLDRWLRRDVLQEAELTGSVRLLFDERLREIGPAIRRAAERYHLLGEARANVRVAANSQGTELTGQLDATDLNMDAAPNLVKPSGAPLRAQFELASPGGLASSPGITPAAVRRASVQIGTARADVQGRLWLDHTRGWAQPVVRDMQAHVALQVGDLAEVGSMWPGLAVPGLRGGLRGELDVARRDGRIGFGPSQLQLEQAGFALADRPVELSGQLSWSQDAAFSDGVSVGIGSSSLVVGGHLEDLSGEPHGDVMVAAERLDLDELRELLEALQQPQVQPQPAPAWLQWPRVIEWVRRCHVGGQGHVARGKLTDRKTGAVLRFDEFIGDFHLEQGHLQIPPKEPPLFLCALGGGVVRGSVAIDLRQGEPYLELKYAAENVEPRPEIVPLIEAFFPGMTVSGLIDIEEHSRQRLLAAPGLSNYSTSEGSMVIAGGAVAGRAAPEWVTRIFPGLNLVRYDFSRMRNWFVKDAEGGTTNRMIFIGTRYNIYVDGYSEANGRIDYQVGIALLARWENPYWVEREQGRIPLFVKTGWIAPGGRLLDENVQYLKPWQIWGHILKDNIVTNAYHALMSQLRKL